MTEQEAIKVLEEKGKHIEMIKIDGKDTLCYRTILVEAFEVATKALEKQIAKKPIEIKGLTFGLTKDGDESYVIICECPNCRSRKLKRGFPCKCGQKLNWE